MRHLNFHVGDDAGVEFAVVVEDTQGVFTHFLTGEEFRGDDSKVKSQLQACAVNLNPHIVMGQQQPTLRMRRRTAGIKKPGG